MDVSIGQLRLSGRVVGSAERVQTPAMVDLLTGPAARQRLLDKLTAAFEGDEVLVFRSLECSATLRTDPGAAEVLASSITASAARLLREHPADDDCVVRFADEAAYVSAYVHDYLDGRQDRWYYQAFEPYRRRDGTTDFASLLAAHRLALRLRILAGVRRQGDLDALLDLMGEQRADELVTDPTEPARADWSPLVATAAAIVSKAAGRGIGPAVTGLVAGLGAAEPPPDWRDASSLGDAVAAATVALLSALRIATTEDLAGRLVAAAAEHEWFDLTSFEQGLAARQALPAAVGESPQVVDRVLSTRARQVLAALEAVVGDPRLRLDAALPTSAANQVQLLAALVDLDPRWDDDELARALARQVLDRWAASGPTPERVGPSPSTPPAIPTPGDARDARPGRGARDDASTPGPEGIPVDGLPVPPPPAVVTPPAVQAVVDLLADRFPRPLETDDLITAPSAAGLLLLRGVIDLGLSPYLLDTTASGRPLLSELLARWSGTAPHPDALHDLLARVAGETTRSSRLDDACRLAARRLVGQGHVSEPLEAVTVPHGNAALVTVAVDESGRLLPFGSQAGQTGLRQHLEEAEVAVAGESDVADVRASVAAVLSSVCVATGTADEIELDLLAVACVQAWARWLPGFSRSSVPFLLDTVVRRDARVDITAEDLSVGMPTRSHDVVLRLAGYLDPLEAGPALGGRRVRFVTGDRHGA